MHSGERLLPASFHEGLIAPCGMNCALCIGYLRDKKRCPGCNGDDDTKPRSCAECSIKTCVERRGDYCFECARYPCARLRRLDARYRTKYGMSMLGNLCSISQAGMEAFLTLERDRWECPGCGGVISVHRECCIYCGRPLR